MPCFRLGGYGAGFDSLSRKWGRGGSVATPLRTQENNEFSYQVAPYTTVYNNANEKPPRDNVRAKLEIGKAALSYRDVPGGGA